MKNLDCPLYGHPRQHWVSSKIVARRIRKDGTLSLYIQLFMKGKKVRWPLDLHVEEKHWSPEREMVVSKTALAMDQNQLIEQAKKKLSAIFLHSRLNEIEISEAYIRERFMNHFNPQCFADYMFQMIEQRKASVVQSTYQKHLNVLSVMKSYQRSVSFSEFIAHFKMYSPTVKLWTPVLPLVPIKGSTEVRNERGSSHSPLIALIQEFGCT